MYADVGRNNDGDSRVEGDGSGEPTARVGNSRNELTAPRCRCCVGNDGNDGVDGISTDSFLAAAARFDEAFAVDVDAGNSGGAISGLSSDDVRGERRGMRFFDCNTACSRLERIIASL